MNKTTLTIFLLTLICSCTSNEIKKPDVFESNNKIYTSLKSLKIISPSKVSLTKSLAFIDTTHSFGSKKIKYWDFVSTDEWIEQEVLKTIGIDYKRDFTNSSKWISMRKLENEFFLYDRSDGIDPCFEFNDEYFIHFGIHEPTATKINDIKKTEETINIWFLDNSTDESSISISPTKDEFVYEMTRNINNRYYKGYLTKYEYIGKFSTIVNLTPSGKQGELFNWGSWGFQEVNNK